MRKHTIRQSQDDHLKKMKKQMQHEKLTDSSFAVPKPIKLSQSVERLHMMDNESLKNGRKLCDLSSFGGSLKDKEVRSRAISERINAIRTSAFLRKEFDKELKFVLKRTANRLESERATDKDHIVENAANVIFHSAEGRQLIAAVKSQKMKQAQLKA